MCKKMKMVVRILILIALTGMLAGVQAQDDDGLVAEWHFDEGSGSIVKDSSGNGNDGVIYGATWVNGKCGKALKFDGKDDYVEVPNAGGVFNLITSWTLEAWVKPFSKGGDCRNDQIIWKIARNGLNEDTFYLAWDEGNRFATSLERASDDKGFDTLSAPHTEYQWYYVVGIYDGANLKIYINGILEGSSNIGSVTAYTGPAPLRIGNILNSDHGNKGVFDGAIDEIRIYNRALSAEEIKAHYEQGQTALTITKSASPHSIKQGQTTTVTLTVKNTGTTEIKDIEVADTIPPDLIFVSGETSKTYASLKPKDSREFKYILQTKEAGTFNLEPATATYADEKGNYHTVKSKTAAITVIPSAESQPSITTKSSTEISTACVHLYGEKTDVVLGADILLKLSAVNKITKPTMTLQVILIPPSGMSVTSADFVESGAGLYTSTYIIEPGMGRDIEVGIRSNQVGDFVVNGEIIYYFGDDKENAEDHTLSLPIKVRASSQQDTFTPTAAPEGEKGIPGFEAVFAVAGLLLAAFLIKRRVE